MFNSIYYYLRRVARAEKVLWCSASVCLCVCVSEPRLHVAMPSRHCTRVAVRRAATAGASHLRGEGNALYPVLSSSYLFPSGLDLFTIILGTWNETLCMVWKSCVGNSFNAGHFFICLCIKCPCTLCILYYTFCLVHVFIYAFFLRINMFFFWLLVPSRVIVLHFYVFVLFFSVHVCFTYMLLCCAMKNNLSEQTNEWMNEKVIRIFLLYIANIFLFISIGWHWSNKRVNDYCRWSVCSYGV